MKKRILIIILVSVLVVAALTIVLDAVITNFFSEGVHVLGKYAHLSFQTTCYLIDISHTETGTQYTPTGETTTLTVSGVVNNWHRFASTFKTSQFSGNATVTACPIPFEENVNRFIGVIDDDIITISNWVAPLTFDLETGYEIYILTYDSDVCVVEIHNAEDDSRQYAVSGENEDDALANLDKYLDEKYS